MKFFIPDTVHFHEKNFKSLFDFFLRHKSVVTKNTEINSWVGLYGNYVEKEKDLKPYLNSINKLKKSDFLSYEYQGHILWKIVRAELLAFFLPKLEFNIHVSSKDDNTQLALMMEIDRRTVCNCYSAAMFFIDYWKKKISEIPIHKYVLIFSGSQIYNRSLLEILQHSVSNPIVLEHFFTGNEYYFEDRYTPIPNRSDLKHLICQFEENSVEYDRRRIKAINKLLLSNNRNVKKTGEFVKIDFDCGETIAVIGQVVNDYSIIETATNYLNSVEFYKELISKAIKKGFNVVFKAHPWERQKTNIKLPFTKEFIEFWANEELTNEERSRLLISETVDIDCLFKQVDYVAGLCSQGLLEASFEGFKSVQFGNAFFGGRGFTSDYQSVDNFFLDIENQKVSKYLSLDEYKSLEAFLVKSLESELVSVHKSGILTLEAKMKDYPLISLLEFKRPPVNVNEHKKNVVVEPSLPKEHSNLQKKLRKLKKSPYDFFKDSKHGIVRALSVIYQ